MNIIFNGIIKEGSDDEFLIDDRIVAEELEDIDFEEKEIHVRYSISNNPINPETIEEDCYKTLIGIIDVEHGCIPFSEWTGFVAWRDTLCIGEHDLIDELLNYEGKHCYLEIYW
jgi:hypothetical protein